MSAIEDKDNREFMQNLPTRKGRDLNDVFKGMNGDAIDLVKKMLVYDEKDRISVEEALEHPFLAMYHAETEEPVEKEPMAPFDFDFPMEVSRMISFWPACAESAARRS